MKKVLSLALALMMLLTMCVVPVAAEDAITDSNTESAEPIFDQLLVQFIGRLPSNDAKNGVFVSLSNDGENWTEPVVYSGHGMDVWGCANSVSVPGFETFFGTIDVTEQAKALTSDKFYVKVGMAAGDITWTVLHQVRIAGTYAGATEQTEFFWEDYSKLAAFNRTGSNADEAAADVVNKVPYAISAHNAFLYSCPVDHTATGLSPYYPGYYGEPENVNAHVVYGINIEPEQPEEPTDKVYFEFLGRMPGDINDANWVQVMVGSDGETWTEAALLEGKQDDHSESTYFKVDITKSVDLSANNLYVKMNLIAYLAEWCSARQIRVTHVAADGTETVLMHVIYDDMAIGSEEYKSGLYVDSANMQLRGTYDPSAADPSGLTMNEDCDGQDGKGLGDNYITYKIVLKEEPEVPDVPEDAIFSELLVQFIGRLPSNDAKNGVFVSLSNDGETWTEPVVYSGHGMDVWGCANTVNPTFLGTIDVTEQAKALTSDKFYVKVGMGAGDTTWTVLHQVRIAGTYAGATEQTEFFWEDYSNLEAFNRTGSNAVEAAEDIVSKVPYAVSANNAYLYSCPVDHTATGLSPYYPGYYGEPENVNAHVVYGINIEPEQPEEPTDKVYFEILGRLPGDGNGANKVQLMVGADGETWNEATLWEGPLDNHGESTYAKIDITDAVDLSANDLYIKMNLTAYLAEWYSVRQIRVTHVSADGVETTLMHVIYDDMTIGSEEYKSGLYVDSANVQLRGTYDPAANDPSGLTVNEDCDGQDGKGLGDCYITYKIVLREPEVPAYLPGDVSGDGRVNNRDLGMLQQYLSDMDVTVAELNACDVTGDGRVNNRDLGILQQYLSDMDVELQYGAIAE